MILLQASVSPLDWVIVIVALAGMLMLGISFKKKASKDLTSFFLGGRNLPWYVAGLSMVATTFAADTPLAVSEIVGQNGISGNWIWWNFLIGGMLTTFFFARLWRRANILTEVEFIELRYGGKPAKILRVFKAVYLGLFINVLIIGWVNLAMATILEAVFGVSHTHALWLCGAGMVIAAIYSSLSGLLGVAITDVVQFFIAMTGSIILAIIVLNAPEVGGISGLKNSLPPETFQYLPSISSGESPSIYSLSIAAFIAFFGFIWWASWYPGAEPGGGGYISQRMMSTPDEPSAIKATLLFQIAHYSLRPWPWILVGLAAISLYSVTPHVSHFAFAEDYGIAIETVGEQSFWQNDPQPELRQQIEDSQLSENARKAIAYQKDTRFGYVFALIDFLPSGLLGLMLVAFFSAYLSTISTQLNWGASYLTNDVYLRTVKPKATDKNLVSAGRVSTVLIMALALAVSFKINSISTVWQFLMECGAGLGLVLILRWFWYRINVWSEISATVAPFAAYAVGYYWLELAFPNSFFFTLGITTAVWVLVTALTPPEKQSVLQNFYNRVKPGGIWKSINKGGVSTTIRPFHLLAGWVSAVVFTYALLFLFGDLLLAAPWSDIALKFVIAAVFGSLKMWALKKLISG